MYGFLRMINVTSSGLLKLISCTSTILMFVAVLFFELHAQVAADSAGKNSKIILLGDTSLVSQNGGLSQNRAFAVDTLYRSPWGAVGRSFLIPGWGQWYNNSAWKTPVFLVTDVSLISVYRIKNRKVQRIESQRKQIDRQIKTDPYLTNEQKQILRSRYSNLTTQLDGALNDRNLYGWLFAISHLLGMVDAYVDAHLYKFKDKMDMAYDPSMNTVYLCWRVQW